MLGKTVLVTGATSGIGRETARALVGLGARVIVVGRDARRAEETVAGLDPARVETRLADFASLADVRRLAAEVKAAHARLDVLVNNAGAFFTSRGVTVDGIEQTWAVNHLAPMLLTLELQDLLKASAPARIVNVASIMHHDAVLPLGGDPETYGISRSYSGSKLANILFTYALARRLEGTGVTVNALHPGVVATNITSRGGLVFRVLGALARPFLRSPARGAETPIHLAASPELDGVTGAYFDDRRRVPSSAASRDEALQERVWEESLRQLGP